MNLLSSTTSDIYRGV